jgi:lambda repressor-like predicted transcriptional regulator
MTSAPASQAIPKNPAKRRAWVGYMLKTRGLSLRALARELGVTHQAVGAALMAPSVRIEQAIADALDIAVTDLFPERFDDLGNRLHITRPANISAGRAPGDSQNDGITQTLAGRAA